MEKKKSLLIFILALGAFSIINTELGVMGILPMIAEFYDISIAQAGAMVSVFALVVAASAPTMPLVLSRLNRKYLLMGVLAIFALGNILSALVASFEFALAVRVVQAIFHPVFLSMAFSLAAASVEVKEAPKAVSKVFIGISTALIIGVPMTTLLASNFGLMTARFYAAGLNILALLAVAKYIPIIKVSAPRSIGSQISVLKDKIVWLSMIAVVFLNGSIIGVYSYFSEFLEKVTQLSWNTISLFLLIFGTMGILGNMIAGKLLSSQPKKLVVMVPIIVFITFLAITLFGSVGLVVGLLTVILGIVGGINGVINQYWVSTSAPTAPEFANGLFISSANIGTTLGTTFAGIIISGIGIQYMAFTGVVFAIASLVFILLRIKLNPSTV